MLVCYYYLQYLFYGKIIENKMELIGYKTVDKAVL